MGNKYTKLLFAIIALFVFGACNNEWEDEQFEHYVSFKAPMNTNVGSTTIYIRYNPGGKVTYKLPLIVSGSTTHTTDLDVHVGLDTDTLDNINKEHYNVRTDLYYRVLRDDQYQFDEVTRIPAGVDVALLDLNFTLGNIDMVDKWVLPLQIMKSPSYNYVANPRKNYSKAILKIIPFNDYSGSYSSSNIQIYVNGLTSTPMNVVTRTCYVVDEKTVFFYAGIQEEDLLERGCYKIFARFNEDNTLTMWADDPNINFQVTGECSYSTSENYDATLPYLLHRYVTMKMSYYYEDYTSVPGTRISFSASGTMITERKINTQIPDEDQAYEW
jgi:hypothetical protein